MIGDKAYIALNTFSTIGINKKKHKVLSCEFGSHKDVKEFTDILIKDLKQINREAEKFFN
ncbi:MAG: hypothetical protein HQ568_10105 [Calditrichaeota bacterium]|nr:hypothetical protein [Calditrichota bacterium]